MYKKFFCEYEIKNLENCRDIILVICRLNFFTIRLSEKNLYILKNSLYTSWDSRSTSVWVSYTSVLIYYAVKFSECRKFRQLLFWFTIKNYTSSVTLHFYLCTCSLESWPDAKLTHFWSVAEEEEFTYLYQLMILRRSVTWRSKGIVYAHIDRYFP